MLEPRSGLERSGVTVVRPCQTLRQAVPGALARASKRTKSPAVLAGMRRALLLGMSGRASRARLLAPSFLLVASALACGETSGGADQGAGAAGAASQTSGGSITIGGPGFGGSSNPPMPIPAGCPLAPPANGFACSAPQTCTYGGGVNGANGCPLAMTFATCTNNLWQVSASMTSCNPPPLLQCPPTLPTPGTSCFGLNSAGLMCTYSGQLCGQEDAWCQDSVWHVDACERLGGAGGEGGVGFGGEPTVGGAADASAGAGGAH
jgi:hypothetical protein